MEQSLCTTSSCLISVPSQFCPMSTNTLGGAWLLTCHPWRDWLCCRLEDVVAHCENKVTIDFPIIAGEAGCHTSCSIHVEHMVNSIHMPPS
jgi:hypothetical protein